MRKWRFWFVMLFTLLVNGGLFYMASANIMRNGIDGANNQASLLCIPLLWMAAGFVLILLTAYTCIIGRKIGRDQVVLPASLFRPNGRAVWRYLYMAAAGCLTLFGYSLFSSQSVLSAAYALSGGVLLV